MKFLTLVLALAIAAGASASARTMVLDDMKLLSGVSDPTISPDGSVIAFTLSKPDYKADRSVRTLMLYDLHDGSARPLTSARRGVASPAWSPDGRRLAFFSITGEGDKAAEQIFVLDMRGGDAMQLTHADNGVEQFTWRPDGGAIAYVTLRRSGKQERHRTSPRRVRRRRSGLSRESGACAQPHLADQRRRQRRQTLDARHVELADGHAAGSACFAALVVTRRTIDHLHTDAERV